MPLSCDFVNCDFVWIFASGKFASACVSRVVFASRDAARRLHEREEVLRVRVRAVEALRRDRDVAERRAALRRVEDPAQRQVQHLARRRLSVDRRADDEVVVLRVALRDERRRRSRAAPGVAALPSVHFRSITLLTVGSTAGDLDAAAERLALSPARTPLTTVTPGTPRSAFSEAVELGVNPFCDVSA